MTSTAVSLGDPTLARLAEIEDVLDAVTSRDPMFLATTEKGEAIVRARRIAQRMHAFVVRVMAHADDLALDTGAHDAGAWTAHHTLSDRARAHADLRLGQALEQRWTHLGEAARAGEASMEQTTVIARALDELPSDLDPELVARAETHLIGLCAHHTPRELRVLGRHVLDVLAPEIAEQADAAALEREEQRASDATRLNLQRLGDGTTRISGRLPDTIAARLRAHLDAFTSPRHTRAVAGDEVVKSPEGAAVPWVVPYDAGTAEQRRGQAFCALLETLDPHRTPLHGGDATTLIITVPLETLQDGLAAAGVVGEGHLSPGQVRRLACSASIIPAVLGARSEILDLGRSRRLYSHAQRKAMAVRDQHCRGEGCGVPAAWCEAHHLRPWSHGGHTNIDDGALLCSWHHHLIHNARYTCHRQPNGDFRFHRRT